MYQTETSCLGRSDTSTQYTSLHSLYNMSEVVFALQGEAFRVRIASMHDSPESLWTVLVNDLVPWSHGVSEGSVQIKQVRPL